MRKALVNLGVFWTFSSCQRELKDGVLFQPIIARCMESPLEQAAINFIDTWLLVQSQKQTHKTHGLTLVKLIRGKKHRKTLSVWPWDYIFHKCPQNGDVSSKHKHFLFTNKKIPGNRINAKKLNVLSICWKTNPKHCLTLNLIVDRIESSHIHKTFLLIISDI